MSSAHFDSAVGGDGSTVSDDANPTTGLARGGHWTRFVPALAQIVAVAQWVLAKANQVSSWAANAAASATAAASSATSAANSANSALATLDAFDDRYLGAKASAPTVDNDGNALMVGALYWRTAAPVGMYAWDGANWLSLGSAPTSASAVGFSPTGGISSSNVQAAIAELDSEKQAVIGYSPVNRAGDSMTGGLTVPHLRVINDGSSETQLVIGNQSVYSFYFSNPTDRSALGLSWCNDSGAYAGTAYSVSRADGHVRFYTPVLFDQGVTVSSGILAAGRVTASGAHGFSSYTYALNSRNPIWRFDNADAYGLSYFQGTAGISGDLIGVHFGDASASGAQFRFRQSGQFDAGLSVNTSAVYASSSVSTQDVYSSWYRVLGYGGMYFESYGGGWIMSDSSWVRCYAGKGIFAQTDIRLGDDGSGANRVVTTQVGSSVLGLTHTPSYAGLYDYTNSWWRYYTDSFGNFTTRGNVAAGGSVSANGNVTASGAVSGAFGSCGTNATGNKTISSAAPSGGSDGDVWYQV